jgi:hypothetical protein
MVRFHPFPVEATGYNGEVSDNYAVMCVIFCMGCGCSCCFYPENLYTWFMKKFIFSTGMCLFFMMDFIYRWIFESTM